MLHAFLLVDMAKDCCLSSAVRSVATKQQSERLNSPGSAAGLPASDRRGVPGQTTGARCNYGLSVRKRRYGTVALTLSVKWLPHPAWIGAGENSYALVSISSFDPGAVRLWTCKISRAVSPIASAQQRSADQYRAVLRPGEGAPMTSVSSDSWLVTPGQVTL